MFNNKIMPIYDVHERPAFTNLLLLSFQHLFAMFGATVLVPYLTGLPVSAALIGSGVGTLLYILVTKGQIPAYLGSSFAFIAAIIAALKGYELGSVLIALFASGLFYVVISMIIKFIGVQWIFKVLPPVIVGPVIMVIGLGLAPVAVNMAMYEDSNAMTGYNMTYIVVAMITLLTTLICSVYFKGIVRLIPVLIGIIVGYMSAIIFGIVDFDPVIQAKWFDWPDIYVPFLSYTPTIDLGLIVMIIPITFVTISEHIGHQMVINQVVGRDFFVKPGLHRSLLGDGLATMFASIIGAPPNTTYGENIGVLAITRIFSIFVIGGAAILAISLAFIGKFTALISTIPTPVMGGVSILLFGIIASSGLKMLVDERIDLNDKRNLMITSVILVLGIGKAYLDFSLGEIHLNIEGMALAATAGIVMNLILPKTAEEESNE